MAAAKPSAAFRSAPLDLAPIPAGQVFGRIYHQRFPDPLGYGKSRSRFSDPRRRVADTNALALVDGAELDWRLDTSPTARSWTKNEKGTQYELTVDADGNSTMYKTTDGGKRRRVSDGHMTAPSAKQIAAILKTY